MSRCGTYTINAPVVLALLFGILLTIANVAKSQNTAILECYCNENHWGDDPTFGDLVNDVLQDLVSNVPSDPDYTDYRTRLSGSDEVYGLGECYNKALSQDECTNCLSTARYELVVRCPESKGGTIEMADCTIRYEDYDFYT